MIPGRLVQISAVQPMSDEVVEAYSAPWPVPESKAGILAFPEPRADLARPSRPPAHLAVRERARALGPARARPLLRLGSDLLAARAERIAAHIPGAGEPEIVAGAGHFLQEDQGEVIGRRISEFVASTS